MESQLGVATAVLDVDVTRALTGVDRFIGGMGRVNRAVDDAGGSAARNTGRIRGFFDAFKNNALGGIAETIGVGLFDRVLGMGAGILTAASNTEQLRNQLEIATGSAERLEEVWSFIQDYAAKTPFESSQLVDISARLETMGVDALQWMETMGNVSAGTGKSIEQVTEAFIDAQFGEYERMKELGIKMTRQGDQLAISYYKNGQKITETVDANNQEIINSTVEAIWNDKYAGAMAKQAGSFQGLLSTVTDNVKMYTAQMTKGLFSSAKGGLKFATMFFESFGLNQSQIGTQAAIFRGIRSAALRSFGPEMAEKFNNVIDHIEAGWIRLKAGAIAAFNLIKLAVGVFMDLWEVAGAAALKFVAKFLASRAIVPVVLLIGRALLFMLSPVGALITLVGLLGMAWQSNFGNIRGIVGAIIDGINVLKGVFEQLPGPVQSAATGIAGFGGIALSAIPALVILKGQLATVGAAWVGLRTTIVSAAGPIIGAIRAIGVAMMTNPIGIAILAIIAIILLFVAAYKTNFLGFADFMNNIFDKVGGAVDRFRAVFDRLRGEGVNPISAAIRALGSAFEKLTGLEVSKQFNQLAKAGATLWRGLRKVVSGFKDLFDAIADGDPGAILDAFITIADGIGDILRAPFEFIGELFEEFETGIDAIDRINQQIGDIFQAGGRMIAAIFSGDWKGALDAGLDLILNFGQLILASMMLIPGLIWQALSGVDWSGVGSAILSGITSGAQAVWDWVSGIGTTLAGYVPTSWEDITNALSGLSGVWDTALQLLGIGWGAVQGLFEGVVEVITGLLPSDWSPVSAITDLLGNVWDTAKGALERAWGAVTGIFTGAGAAIVALLPSDNWASVLSITNHLGTVWDQAKTAVANGFEAVKKPFTGAIDVIKGLLPQDAWQSVVDLISPLGTVWDGVKTLVVEGFDAVKAPFIGAIDVIKGLLPQDAWQSVKDLIAPLGTAWDGVKTTLEESWGAVKGVFETAQSGIEAVTSYDWGFVATAFEGLTTGIDTVKTNVTTPIDGVKTAIGGVRDLIKTATDLFDWGFVEGAFSGLITAIETVADAVAKPVGAIKDAFRFAQNDLFNGGSDSPITNAQGQPVYESGPNAGQPIPDQSAIPDMNPAINAASLIGEIYTEIQTAGTNIATETGNIITGLSTFVTNMGTKGTEAGQHFKNMLGTVMATVQGDVGVHLSALETGMNTFTTNMGTKGTEAGDSLMEALVAGITSGGPLVDGAVVGIASAVLVTWGGFSGDFETLGTTFDAVVAGGISANGGVVASAVEGVVRGGISAGMNAASGAGQISARIVDGLLAGLNDGGRFAAAVGAIVQSGIDAGNAAAGNASPSKKAIKLSGNVGKGLVIGALRYKRRVSDAYASLINFPGGPNPSLGTYNGGRGGGGNSSTVVYNNQQIQVSGAGDPRAVANEVVRVLARGQAQILD